MHWYLKGKKETDESHPKGSFRSNIHVNLYYDSEHSRGFGLVVRVDAGYYDDLYSNDFEIDRSFKVYFEDLRSDDQYRVIADVDGVIFTNYVFTPSYIGNLRSIWDR